MTFYDEAAVEEDGITTIDMSAVVDVAAVSTSARRRKDRLTTSTTFTRTTTTTMTSMILLLLFSIFGTPLAATAGLLDDYGTDPKKMVDNTANKNGVAAGVVVAKPKADVAIDPTLRGCT